MKPVEAVQAVVDQGLVDLERACIVACSGGLDSVALFHASLGTALSGNIHLATVDHGLHPKSTDQADFVMRLGRLAGVPAKRLIADTDAIGQGPGVEAGARRERYRLLRTYASKIGAGTILTAHTADDQAETLLMRLNEGAGIRGLRGILPENDGVVRPWLEVARRDIRQWALAKGLSWCEDPTNGDTRFQRNSLRREGLPGLSEAFGQTWVHRAARSARNVLNMHRAWEVLLEPIYADAVTLHGRATYISSDAITGMDESVAAAVLDKALSDTVARLGGSRLSSHRGQVEAILKLFSRSGQGAQVAIGGGLVAHRDRSNVVLTTEDKPPDATADQRLLIEGFGEYQFGGWAISVLDGGRFTPSIEGACSSLEGSPFPWVARCAQEAELYHQLGGPGHRPILRLWMDAGLPKRARASTPVIAKDGKGLWAPLVRPSEEARAEPGDKIAKVIFRHREYLAEMP